MNPQKFASLLPDIPRWVETRGLLLSGRGEVMATAHQTARDFVVRGFNNRLISVVGQPPPKSLLEAITKSGADAEVLAMPESDDHVAAILSTKPIRSRRNGWQRFPAILHQLAPPVEFRTREQAAVRFIQAQELHSLKKDFPDLVDELLDALNFTAVAAVFVDDQPVSFCFAGGETETLWDISIETLPAYQRRGYARQAVIFLSDFMQQRNKRPVWGAEESHVASLKLAAKLGFQPVDRVIVFRGSE